MQNLPDLFSFTLVTNSDQMAFVALAKYQVSRLNVLLLSRLLYFDRLLLREVSETRCDVGWEVLRFYKWLKLLFS